jgi:hypothetical protein
MNDELFPEITKKQGERIKAWCCDKELDCELKIYANGTRHAIGQCPICGKKGAKSQRLAPSLEELKHRLMWIDAMMFAMPEGIDKDEASAMIERCAERNSKAK